MATRRHATTRVDYTRRFRYDLKPEAEFETRFYGERFPPSSPIIAEGGEIATFPHVDLPALPGPGVEAPPATGPANYLQQKITVATTSVQLLGTNTKRRTLMIQNKGSTSIFLQFGGVAAAAAGLEIESGAFFEPYLAPQNSIHAIASSGSNTVIVIEG